VKVLRALIGLALAGSLLVSVAAENDPLVGEFRMDQDATGATHKFWKKGSQYFYASCDAGQCSSPQPASLLEDQTLAGWFEPGDRWKTVGAKGITVDGSGGLALFHVDRPDERVLQRTSTKYLFSFWILTGSAERVGE
jgi:hypothetical protein